MCAFICVWVRVCACVYSRDHKILFFPLARVNRWSFLLIYFYAVHFDHILLLLPAPSDQANKTKPKAHPEKHWAHCVLVNPSWHGACPRVFDMPSVIPWRRLISSFPAWNPLQIASWLEGGLCVHSNLFKVEFFFFKIRPKLVQTLWMTLQSLWFHMCYQPCVRWSHTYGLKHTFVNTQTLILCFLSLYSIVQWVDDLASSPIIVSLLSKAFDLVVADHQTLTEWDKVAQTSLLCTHTASSCQPGMPITVPCTCWLRGTTGRAAVHRLTAGGHFTHTRG